MTGVTCCVSDKRVKTAIEEANTADALKRVSSLSIKQFKYTPEYQVSDKSVKNTTYYGVIAQEIKDDFGYMVDVVKRKVGQVTHHDFHVIRPELLYGEIVGAVQHLHTMHTNLKARVDQLENQAAQKVYDVSASVSKFEQAAKERINVLRKQAGKGIKTVAHTGRLFMHDLYARISSLEARLDSKVKR